MNWVKKNTFLSVFLAVVLVIGSILGFFLFSAYSSFTAISQEYDSQVGKLQSLQNRAPFPSRENNERYAALATEYKQEYQNLLSAVAKMQVPLEAISPQAFQDRLRAVVSEVEAAAKAAGVTLEPDFYMGFDQYKGQLPPDKAAGPLARQLAAIKSVVDSLVQNRVKSIVSITREPLPEEPAAAPRNEARTLRPITPGAKRPASPPANAEPVVSAFPFEITFVAEQGRLRQSLNAIVRSSQFVIIRYLTVTNSATEGPARVAEGLDANGMPLPAPGTEAVPPPEQVDGAAPAAASEPAKPALNVLVGRETLTVAARIEVITFHTPDSKN
jgi:hypothetical protein